MGTSEILSPDSRRKAVVGCIGQFNYFLFRIKWANVATRAKDFLLDHRCRLRQPSPVRGFNPGTFYQLRRHVWNTTSSDDSGTVIFRHGIVVELLFTLLLTQQLAIIHARVGTSI